MSFWTYIAQIVNFFIFVVILYFLLYKPVRSIMQQRKDEMEAELREAEKKLKEAEQLRAEAEKAAKELEDKRDAVLKEARDQAEAIRVELLKQTEQQGRERLERFRRIMEQERRELLDQISKQLRETIVQIAGAILGDASSGLAERAIARIGELLAAASEDERAAARRAVESAENRVEVHSAVDLDEAQTERLKNTIAEHIGIDNVTLNVTEDPSLLAGLEVTLGHVNLQAHWGGVIDEALRKQKEAT